MKIKVKCVDIRRSETTVIRVEVPAWELPLLEALHGKTALTPAGDRVIEGDVPEATAEFERLSARYGAELNKDGSRGMIIAEAVYGQFQPGIMNLQRSIDAAVTN